MKVLEKLQNGAKWNYKLYGNYLYVDNQKTLATDSEVIGIIEFVKKVANFEKLCAALEMVSGSYLQAFTPSLVASFGDWILNVKQTDHHNGFNCIFRLYKKHKETIEFPMNYDFHATPKSKY